MGYKASCTGSGHPFLRFAPFAIAFALAAGCGGSAEGPQAAAESSAAATETAPSSPAEARTAQSSAGAGTAASSSRRSAAYSGPDIAGVFIGMTQEEVEAAIRAYDPEAVFQYNQATYRYTALNQRFQTDPFLQILVAAAENRTVVLQVLFSPPPGESRVVGIERSHGQRTAPLTQADYASALIDKYGPPSGDEHNGEQGYGSRRTLTWQDSRPGKVECVPSVSFGTSILDALSGPRANLPEDGNVDDCARVMTYTLHQDPVFNARGLLYDVAAAARGEQAAQEWVRSLEAEASRPGTERPTL